MLKTSLLGLAPLLLSGCAAIYTAERFSPTLLTDDSPLTASTRDHELRLSNKPWRWSGEDRLIDLRSDDEGPALALSVGVVDCGGAIWAAGPLLPIVPLFGLLHDELEESIHVQLRLLEGGSPVTLDPREIELVFDGQAASVRPNYLTEWGYRWYDATAIEDYELPVTLVESDKLQLFFPGSVEDAERMTLRLPLVREDGSTLIATIRFDRGTALYFAIAG